MITIFQSECGKNPKILCIILLVPHNVVMDVNNVMYVNIKKETMSMHEVF